MPREPPFLLLITIQCRFLQDVCVTATLCDLLAPGRGRLAVGVLGSDGTNISILMDGGCSGGRPCSAARPAQRRACRGGAEV